MRNDPWYGQSVMNAVRLAVVFGIVCGMVRGAMAAESPGFDAQVAPIPVSYTHLLDRF